MNRTLKEYCMSMNKTYSEGVLYIYPSHMPIPVTQANDPLPSLLYYYTC